MTRRRRRTKTEKSQSISKPQAARLIDERYIVTLFADIIGCSEISNHENLSVYNEFLNDFQKCFKEVCDHYEEIEYEDHERVYFKREVRGDEGCLMIFISSNDDSLPKDIDVAIKIALDLKRNWLFTKHNITRIQDDCLLPVDLGIGIHSGKVFLNKEDKRPEGYAINLAKRVESESRDGKFTHILVSESARGQLYKLTDEPTYKFDIPFSIEPKGISREIKVFEVKHHFLPTDWYDLPLNDSVIYPKIDDNKVGIAKTAYEINPTNLWLGEEYILLSMVNSYLKLDQEGKVDDLAARKVAFRPALEIARHIANTDLRDAGLLAIQGLITGERGDYKEEQKRYEEGKRLEEQYGEIYWYMAYSMSDELSQKFDKEQQKNMKIEKFYKVHKESVEKILEEYRKALERRPISAWIVYDYSCELSWWSQVEKEMRKEAIDNLIKAFKFLPETKLRAKDEDYLKPIIDDPKVKRFL